MERAYNNKFECSKIYFNKSATFFLYMRNQKNLKNRNLVIIIIFYINIKI